MFERTERNFCCCYCGDDGSDFTTAPDDDESGADDTDVGSNDDGSSSEKVRNTMAARLAAKRAAPPLRWYATEEHEPFCGYEHCRATFPHACRGADTVVFSGATGVGDYTLAKQVSGKMVEARCAVVMKESAAWWGEFMGLVANGID